MFSFDVGSDDFQKVVIEGSQKVPVVVDFWAEWCGPCKILKPILEKLVEEYQGKFILAKVDSDKNQALAAQFGVRGIPNVKAFLGGQVVDEFSGALPESEVRAFLERIIPSPGEELRLKAVQTLEAGDSDAALSQLMEAQAFAPENERIKLDLARIYLAQQDIAAAKQQLDSLSFNARMEDAAVELINKVEFAEKSQGLPDEASLQQRIQNNEKDLEARLQLANRCISEQRYQAAMDQLLEIIRIDRDYEDDIGRKTMLAVFNLISDQGELVRQYRRRMAALLN